MVCTISVSLIQHFFLNQFPGYLILIGQKEEQRKPADKYFQFTTIYDTLPVGHKWPLRITLIHISGISVNSLNRSFKIIYNQDCKNNLKANKNVFAIHLVLSYEKSVIINYLQMELVLIICGKLILQPFTGLRYKYKDIRQGRTA